MSGAFLAFATGVCALVAVGALIAASVPVALLIGLESMLSSDSSLWFEAHTPHHRALVTEALEEVSS